MMRYSVQPRDPIIVKDYGLLSFANSTGKNIIHQINHLNLGQKIGLK